MKRLVQQVRFRSPSAEASSSKNTTDRHASEKNHSSQEENHHHHHRRHHHDDDDVSTVPSDEPSSSSSSSSRLLRHRFRLIAFFLGLYRVYVYENLRGIVDLFRDQDQFNAVKDFFGMFCDHFGVQKRSVRKDILGLLMLAAYGPQEQRHGSSTGMKIMSPDKEERLVEDACRAMQFSAAAYGWSMLNHMASIFNLNFMPTAKLEWTGIPTPRSARTPADSPASAAGDESSVHSLSRGDSGINGLNVQDDQDRMEANLSGETTIMSIVEGINPEDILYSNFSSSDRTSGKLPNHFIVLDHEKKAAVIAFRGTFSLSEAITDVNCLPVEFSIGGEEGFAHVAMANGARLALKVLEDVVLAVVDCYPEHRLWIVGHSLGAGVASLFAILLKEKYPELPIECFAFGCPGVLSLNLARKVSTYFDEIDKSKPFSPPLSFMQAFSAGDDNIPRLSQGSILDLVAMGDTLWDFFDSKKDGCYSALRYSMESSSSWFSWLANSILVFVILSLMALFGYAAKVSVFFERLFRLRGSLPRCPSNLKLTSKLFATENNDSERSMRSGRAVGWGDDVSSESDSNRCLRKMPSLFAKLSETPKTPRTLELEEEIRSDSFDFSEDGNSPLYERQQSIKTFAEVVEKAESKLKRDKMVQKAARKFLMAAHHDKLYPPSVVYHIQFGSIENNRRVAYYSDPLKYYGLEISKPEYFGWLLFSGGMMFHHLPRSYLHSLAVLRQSINLRRRNAKRRWDQIRRKSRLASILSRFALSQNMGTIPLHIIDALERASDSFNSWVETMEMAGKMTDVQLPNPKSIASTKKSVKDRFRAKKAWKRARIKTKAIQHLSKAEESLQKALQDIHEKQKDLELSARSLEWLDDE